MSDKLKIRVYNVRFGDAILITVPDRDPGTGDEVLRRILIDVGNAPTVASPEGGDDAVFKPVIEDIVDQLDGGSLDLYVMTHEHLDHVQGIPYAAWKIYSNGEFEEVFKVDHVWMTASAEADYYEHHPEAKKKKLAFDEMFDTISKHLEFIGEGETRGFGLNEMLGVNNPLWTRDCVGFLRGLNPEHTTYVYRGVDLGESHPFKEAKFSIWAPEEDTSEYYGRILPLHPTEREESEESNGVRNSPAMPPPPPGVDAGAFVNLLEARRGGIPDNLLAIDKAANETSVVFSMEWRGWKFLFTGDAEEKSWHFMKENDVLEPVHFLKVSHHGSSNGTPTGDVFDAILPENSPDGRERVAVISTWRNTYNGIPHPPTNARIESRCRLVTNLDQEDDLYFDLEFPP
jgi:beta-lactamase superfamily II metal-dependent hydrolase